jgi:selenocysteine lyase/cysteine desulfurase
VTAINWKHIRKQFPAIDAITYLNTAEGGALSAASAEAGSDYFFEAQIGGDLPWYNWVSRVEDVRGKLAKFLNTEITNLGFTSSVALSMNILADLFNRSGSVLTIADEFPSVTLPWLQRGYELNFVASKGNGSVSIDDFADSITTDTKFIVCSHIGFSTGFCLDLRELSEFCRSRKIHLIIDATQSAGSIKLDLTEINAAAVVFSCYKWMAAGYGTTVAYISPKLLATSKWNFAGWWNAKNPYEMINDHVNLKSSGALFEMGQPNFSSIFASGAAVDLMLGVSIDEIENRNAELTSQLTAQLTEIGLVVSKFENPKNDSPIVMVTVENAEKLVGKLKEKNIFVSSRRGKLRISPHFYNDESDLQALITALRSVL